MNLKTIKDLQGEKEDIVCVIVQEHTKVAQSLKEIVEPENDPEFTSLAACSMERLEQL